MAGIQEEPLSRGQLLQQIKQRGWSFRPAVSGKEFYGLVDGINNGAAFHFHAPVPYTAQEDHSDFLKALCSHLSTNKKSYKFIAEQ